MSSTTGSNSVSWKPKEFSTITAQVAVNNCLEAIDWYIKTFGAEKLRVKLDPHQKVMHAEIKIGESIMFFNDPSECAGCPVSGSSFFFYVPDVDLVYKRALDAGAVSKMPPGDMFWGDRLASITDPYGQNWAIVSRIKEMTEEEVNAAETAFFSKCNAASKPNNSQV